MLEKKAETWTNLCLRGELSAKGEGEIMLIPGYVKYAMAGFLGMLLALAESKFLSYAVNGCSSHRVKVP